MKVGDKVYCIKDCIITHDILEDTLTNKKGKYYTIDKININRVLITTNYKLVVCDFSLNKLIGKYFYDYFITEQQYRKLKLEKIYESGR